MSQRNAWLWSEIRLLTWINVDVSWLVEILEEEDKYRPGLRGEREPRAGRSPAASQ